MTLLPQEKLSALADRAAVVDNQHFSGNFRVQLDPSLTSKPIREPQHALRTARSPQPRAHALASGLASIPDFPYGAFVRHSLKILFSRTRIFPRRIPGRSNRPGRLPNACRLARHVQDRRRIRRKSIRTPYTSKIRVPSHSPGKPRHQRNHRGFYRVTSTPTSDQVKKDRASQRTSARPRSRLDTRRYPCRRSAATIGPTPCLRFFQPCQTLKTTTKH